MNKAVPKRFSSAPIVLTGLCILALASIGDATENVTVAEMSFADLQTAWCVAGNGTKALRGCSEGVQLSILLTGTVGSARPVSVTFTSAQGEEEASRHLPCSNVLTREVDNGLLVSCTAGTDTDPQELDPNNAFWRSEVTEFQLLIDGVKVSGGATIEFERSIWVKRIEPDPEGCVTSGELMGCEQGSIIALIGRGLSSVLRVSFHQKQSDCEAEAGNCEILQQANKRITCRMQLPKSRCLSLFPFLSFTFHTRSSTFSIPYGFTVSEPPSVHSLSFQSGCASSVEGGVLALQGCKNESILVVTGAFLTSPVSNETLVVLRSRDATATCDIMLASYVTLVCQLRSTSNSGIFSLHVVTSAGRSTESAVVRMFPSPKVTSLSYVEGCQGGSESLSLVQCSNGTVVRFHGDGLEPSSTVAKLTPDQCSCVGLPEDHTGAGSFACRLACPEHTNRLSFSVRLEVAGTLTNEQLTIDFIGPPRILGVSSGQGCASPAFYASGVPIPPMSPESQPNPYYISMLEGCTQSAIVTLHGQSFYYGSKVFLFATIPSQGGTRSIRPKQPDPPYECVTDVSVSTSAQLICKIVFPPFHPSSSWSPETFAVRVASAGGLSVPPSASPGVLQFYEKYKGPWSTFSAADMLKVASIEGIQETPRPTDLELLSKEVKSVMLKIYPVPHIINLKGCRGTTDRCVLRDGDQLTIEGEGFRVGQSPPQVLFVPTERPVADNATSVSSLAAAAANALTKLREKGTVVLPVKPVPVPPASEVVCDLSAITKKKLLCRISSNGLVGVFSLLIKTPGGSGEKHASILLLPSPKVSAVTGCEALTEIHGNHGEGRHPVLYCKEQDMLTFSGEGLGALDGASLPVSLESQKDAKIIQRRGLADVTGTKVVVNLKDVSGRFTIRFMTGGGELLLPHTVEVLPPPRITHVASISCRSSGWPNPISCPRGAVIEVVGEHFLGVKEVHMLQAKPPPDFFGGEQPFQQANVPCKVLNFTKKAVQCRMDHMYEGGTFYPQVFTDTGVTDASTSAIAIGHVALLPIPKVSFLSYPRAGQCLEGNNTKELSGCQSGTRISIHGDFFIRGSTVRIKAGAAGGRNGPPECWPVVVEQTRIVCVLDHTSAAGAFELTVFHQNGESLARTVSVIPGNLYLLFKNTRMVLAISNIVGWVCACVWTGSLAMLVYSNEVARSTAGVAPDMVLYNAVGLLCWCVYCTYFYTHSELGVPIFIQDIAYTVTSYGCIIIFITQMIRFGSASISLFAKLYCVGCIVFLIRTGLTPGIGFTSPDFVSNLAKVHLACAVVKYMPQAHYNYVRKSTEGYSIGAVWLDFSGAVLLLLQMFFDGIMRHKWSLMITLNVPKFALACEVILFNLIYAFQHYVLYNGNLLSPPTPVKSPLRKADKEDTSSPDHTVCVHRSANLHKRPTEIPNKGED